jgi:hypothetical protein
LQDRDSGGCLEEAAADQGVLHRQDAPAETVVVPETASFENTDFSKTKPRISDAGLYPLINRL